MKQVTENLNKVRYMSNFVKNNFYTIEEINSICHQFNLATVDCLKDENMITVEGFNEDGDLDGEFCGEFLRIEEDKFKLIWLK
jgi:hypothetical protein